MYVFSCMRYVDQDEYRQQTHLVVYGRICERSVQFEAIFDELLKMLISYIDKVVIGACET